jgi:hypothetical protein
MTLSRHPEVLAKRASKGDGPGRAAILRGPLRGRLRMTVNVHNPAPSVRSDAKTEADFAKGTGREAAALRLERLR